MEKDMFSNLKIMTAVFAFSVSLMAMEAEIQKQDENLIGKTIKVTQSVNKSFSSPVPDIVQESRAIFEKEEKIRREIRIERERFNGRLNAALASHYPIVAPYAGALAETEIALEDAQRKLGNFAKGVAKLESKLTRTRKNNQALRDENRQLKNQIERMKNSNSADDGF